MKSLREYLIETEETFDRPTVGDNFAINIREETLLETWVCDETEDGIVLYADDTAMSLLEDYGYIDTELTESQDFEIDSDENDVDVVDQGEYDQEGDMAKDELATIVRAARRLTGMLDDNENMPEWVQSKITKAADYVDTAADYIESNKTQGVAEGFNEQYIYLSPMRGLSEPKFVAKVKGRVTNDILNKLAAKYKVSIEDFEWGDAKWAQQHQGVAEGSESEQAELAKKIRELLAAGKDREANHLRRKLNQLKDLDRIRQKNKQGVAEGNKKTPGVALSKAYKKDFDGKRPEAKQQDIALSAAYSKTGKPGGPLDKGVAEAKKVASHAELAKSAHEAYIAAVRQGNALMANHYKQAYEKHKRLAASERNSAAKGMAEGHLHNPGQEDSPVAQAITRRILMQRTDLLAKYGPVYVGQAIDDVADSVRNVDEIGSSDVSGWVRQVEWNLKNKLNQYDEPMDEAKYQGREVPLGKPMKGDVKKSKVYVRGPKGNVVKVNFGQKGMKIKKNIPGRRKNFRARHNCDNPGPRWKARYWSCRAW